MNYKNKAHEVVFKTYVAKCPFKLPARTLAAIYILSADNDTWKRSRKCIEKKEINFKNISLKESTGYEYLLIKAANDIYDMDQSHFNLYDISDRFVVSDKTYELIKAALDIARYGYDALDIVKKFD